jgi:hypothetical protein
MYKRKTMISSTVRVTDVTTSLDYHGRPVFDVDFKSFYRQGGSTDILVDEVSIKFVIGNCTKERLEKFHKLLRGDEDIEFLLGEPDYEE